MSIHRRYNDAMFLFMISIYPRPESPEIDIQFAWFMWAEEGEWLKKCFDCFPLNRHDKSCLQILGLKRVTHESRV
jgi:hypothetical protein